MRCDDLKKQNSIEIEKGANCDLENDVHGEMTGHRDLENDVHEVMTWHHRTYVTAAIRHLSKSFIKLVHFMSNTKWLILL